MGIFLAGWFLFSCSSDEPEVVEELKKANAKDFSFSLLSVSAKEVSIEKIKSILKNPAGWTIKSLKIDDSSFAEVTGTNVKDFKIKIKKAGEFSFSITLQKTGYEDFVLKGVKIKATFLADAKDFDFPLLPVNAKEVSFAVLRGNVRSPAGWTIKTIAVVDSSFGAVTGAGSNQKITIKKDGTFVINITLQKTGWVDFVLKGKIKASTPTQPLKKADAKDFDFPLLPVNVKEVSFAVLRGNLTSPAGWTIKSLTIVDSDFGEVTGAGINQKITIKKDGTFAINITLGKTGYEDFVLKGKIKASTPTQPLKKADPSNFSFPELPVNAKEILIATIERNITKPTGWTIKSIAIVDSSFGEVTGAGSSQKIVLKKGGTFVINITLQKTGFVDYVLKGNVKAADLTATASDFGFPELPVNAKEIPFAAIENNLTKPAGWTIKSIAVADASFGAVTGAGSSQKIVLKKGGGTLVINITLQKTGWVDFVLKGNIKAANFKADAKDFSFTLLPVNVKEVTIEQLKKNLNAPAGWTIKSIKIDDTSFADVDSQLKITIKKADEFSFSITLQKTGYEDFVLKGSIKASGDVFLLIFDKATKTITGVTDKTIKTINIPATIEEVAVEKIGEKAFYECRSLTSVTIPDKVTTIGKWAFYYCSSLTSVTIPNSVTTIEDRAFSWCNKLTSVTIPDKVTTIGEKAFSYCSKLTSVTIPNSVTTIGESTFQSCSKLTSVTIPDKVTTIGESTFESCSSLTSVTIPNSVTTIGEDAFYECSSLTSVTIPNSVTMIGDWAFYYCTALTIRVPHRTTIGSYAFHKVKKVIRY